MVTTRPPKTIVKPTALGPVANTDTKLLIYGLFQKGRVLAQDGLKPIWDSVRKGDRRDTGEVPYCRSGPMYPVPGGCQGKRLFSLRFRLEWFTLAEKHNRAKPISLRVVR